MQQSKVLISVKRLSVPLWAAEPSVAAQAEDTLKKSQTAKRDLLDNLPSVSSDGLWDGRDNVDPAPSATFAPVSFIPPWMHGFCVPETLQMFVRDHQMQFHDRREGTQRPQTVSTQSLEFVEQQKLRDVIKTGFEPL